MNKFFRRIGRIVLVLAIFLLSLVLGIMVSIQIPFIQTKLSAFVLEQLNKTYDVEMAVESLHIDFFGDINIRGVSVKDDHDLKFIEIERAQLKLSIWSILRDYEHIKIKQLDVYQPKVQVIVYENDSISNFLRFVEKFDDKKPKKKKSNFRMEGNIDVINGTLSIIDNTLKEEDRVWITSNQINLSIKDFKVKGSEVYADLRKMSLKAKKNNEDYDLQNFSTKFHFSNKGIHLDELNFKTADSDLKGKIALLYNEPKEMSDFNNKVNWEVEIEPKSVINFKDIRYFAKEFNKNTSLNISGKITGPLNDFKMSQVQLSGNNNFASASEFRLRDMLDDQLSIVATDLKINTSYKKLQSLLPTFLSEKITDYVDRFGDMDYSGNFNLNSNAIDIKGTAITALGVSKLDIGLKNYSTPSALEYEGSVEVDNLSLAQITDVKELGFIKGSMYLSGKGIDLKNLVLEADGQLEYIDLLGKRFHNLVLNGKLLNSKFNGLLTVNDTYLKATYDGVFDFSAQPYYLNFESKVNHIDLDYLGLTKDLKAFVTKADIRGNFHFSSLDDFIGKLDVENLDYRSKDNNLILNKAHLESAIVQGEKEIYLNIPSYLSGSIRGDFILSQLPNSILNALSEIVPSIEKKPTKDNQDFDFSFNVEQNLFAYFIPDLEIESGTVLKGNFNTISDHLVLSVKTSGISYAGVKVYKTDIDLDTSLSDNKLVANSDSISVKNVVLRDFNLHTNPSMDSLMLVSKFNIGKEKPIKFDLNLFHTLDKDKNYVFGFSPSFIDIDKTIWNLNKDNDSENNRVIVNLEKKYYELQDIVLNTEEQELKLSGHYSNENDFLLDADLKNLILSKIIPKEFLGDLSLDGIANGEIDIKRTVGEFTPKMKLKVDSININGYRLGDLALNGGYNVEENVFDIEASLDQGAIQALYVNGFIDNKPKIPQLNMTANFDELHISFLEAFLSSVFSNMRGMVSGDVNFKGDFMNPSYSGILDVEDLGLKIDFLNTDYLFEGTNSLAILKQGNGQGIIELDNIKFKDTRFNTKGNVSGSLLFKELSQWFINLSFDTDNLLVMNTTIRNNELFYGRLFGKGVFDIFGPPEAVEIAVEAELLENSLLTINTGSTSIETENTLVRFVPSAKSETKDVLKSPKGMTIDMNINAYPNSTINLVFDAKTDDMVIANGTAENLKVKMSNSGLTIDGAYIIESGEYKLRQIPLMTKDFDIREGSSVRWAGSPYDADLNITAVYEKSVSNLGDYLGIGYSQTFDANLLINIENSLKKPRIIFDLVFPKAGTDVQSQLDSRFKANPDEKMMQFGFVMLTGQFQATNALTSGITSTAAELALKQLGGLLSSIMKELNVEIEYIEGSEQSATNAKVKTRLEYKLNPRLKIMGAAGIPLANTYSESFTGEVNLSYDVSKRNNGSLVVNAFSRPTTFGVENFSSSASAASQSYGGGINYRTSFNNITELFKKNKIDFMLEDVKREQTVKDSTKLEKDSILPIVIDSISHQ